MAKLYWAEEVKRVMEDKLREKTDRLIANRDGDAEKDEDALREIRYYKRFADEIYAEMAEADRKEAEEREARKAEENGGETT